MMKVTYHSGVPLKGIVRAMVQLPFVLKERLVSMFTDAIFAQFRKLLEELTDCVHPILESMSKVTDKCELFQEGELFRVLVAIMDATGKIEDQEMRCWQGQSFNSNVVRGCGIRVVSPGNECVQCCSLQGD